MAPAQETQGVTVLPPCSGSMEGDHFSFRACPLAPLHPVWKPLQQTHPSQGGVLCSRTGQLEGCGLHRTAWSISMCWSYGQYTWHCSTAAISSVPEKEACASTVGERLNRLSHKPPRGNQVCMAVAGVQA